MKTFFALCLSLVCVAASAQDFSPRLGRAIIKTVAGVGGANTNFTFVPGEYQVNAGTTNLNLVAIMGGQAGRSDTCLILATNRTATPRIFSVSSVTNNWIAIGSLTFPLNVTNALWVSTKVRGSNVFYAAQYVANPTD